MRAAGLVGTITGTPTCLACGICASGDRARGMPSKEAWFAETISAVDWRGSPWIGATSGRNMTRIRWHRTSGAPGLWRELDLAALPTTGLVLMIEPLCSTVSRGCACRLPERRTGSAAQRRTTTGAIRRVDAAGYLDTTPGKAVANGWWHDDSALAGSSESCTRGIHDRCWRIEGLPLSMAADDGIALPE